MHPFLYCNVENVTFRQITIEFEWLYELTQYGWYLMAGKIVLGMTGPFGSGCTYVAKKILSKEGYEYISLSDILRKEIGEPSKTRTELQDAGNLLRQQRGNDYLAQQAISIINQSEKEKFVVDSIRNTHEIESLQNAFSSFFLFAVWASDSTRWERIKNRYNSDESKFEEDDSRDKSEKNEYGQQITLCYQMADYIILNEEIIHSDGDDQFAKLKKTTQRCVSLIEKKEEFMPFEEETLMAMAYANSMRSSCTQRKVGALIVDDTGNIFSSGYNEVPSSEKSCKSAYGMCYRKFVRNDVDNAIHQEVGDDTTAKTVSGIIKNKFKILDLCRALHAEENAIINMTRSGVSTNFGKATLYTTTYPCNLCANKIAQVGIKKVIYYEPYPQKEALPFTPRAKY